MARELFLQDEEKMHSVEKIAFIGTGVMGFAMASNLLKKGFKLKVYNRTRAKAEPLAALGATVCDSVAEAVRDADVAISIVGMVSDVEETWLGADGILKNLPRGAIGVDMTTSSPSLARRLATKGEMLGLEIMDAPVTGGDVGARNGTLTILCGGRESTFKTLTPVFEGMGRTWVRFGEAGAGQLAKAANQIAIAAGMMALCESMVFAKKSGLDVPLLLETLGKGAAGSFSMQSYGPRILKGDFKPGFFVKHFVKDLRIALEVAQEHGLYLEGTALALKLYETLMQKGLSEAGTQALYRYYTRDFA